MRTAAVLVHGLFLNGAEFALLRRRLQREHGFECHRFSYPTVRGDMARTVERLTIFVEGIDADRVHFVGHSLGGIVLCRYFEQEKKVREGRVVFLGSPANGSRSAQAVARHSWLRPIVGKLVARELVDECAPRCWNGRHDLGVIAGTRPMGLGRFFANFDEDCDGTVGVSETKLPGHSAHVTVPVSHMGLLVDSRVAAHVGAFLEHGHFQRS